MNHRSIGLVELTSVASGFLVADTMLKTADVELLLSRTICSGKYLVLVGGEIAAVQAVVQAGAAIAGEALIQELVIPNLHPDVFRALGRCVPLPEIRGALGILESFNVAALIEAADTAAKAAEVNLVELRVAMALGGKSFLTLVGEVSAVQASIAAGRQTLSAAGVLVNSVVIPGPHPDVYREIV